MSASHRRLTAAAAGVATLALLGTVAASPALAASGVTIKTSYENSPVSLNTSDAVGFAISNTTGATETVTFTDTLPAGVALDAPVTLTTTPASGLSSSVCTSVTDTNPSSGQPSAPGDAAVTVTATVAPETSGTVCTISLGVLAGTPSVADTPIKDTYSNVSVTPTAAVSETAGSLVVLSNPTLTFSAPAAGQSFYLGQIADASFACAATDTLDSIDSFFGTDDEGNQIESGAPIDTVDPGSHTLEVDCYSAAGGGSVSQSVSYTVGSFTLSAVRESRKTDAVTFRTLVPAGKLTAELIYGKRVIGKTIRSTTSRSTATVKIKPTPVGRRLLAALSGRSAAATLQVAFTPQAIGTGDQQITPAAATVLTKNVKLPLVQAARKKHASARR